MVILSKVKTAVPKNSGMVTILPALSNLSDTIAALLL